MKKDKRNQDKDALVQLTSLVVPTATPVKSDALFKKIMQEEVAAREFLEHYLAQDVQEFLDLSKIQIEKESFVDNKLTRNLSDVIYSVATKNNEKAFIYVLIENQSTVDNWISLRLAEYTLLLLNRHKKDKKKLPLVVPLVIYNGMKKYTAPRNLWDLFADPKQAKKLMTENYKLVDLQAMHDDEITKKKHLGMMEYFLKHIHDRDMLKVWENFFTQFKDKEVILIEKENEYLYLRLFICYTDAKVPMDSKQALNELIKNNLPKEDGEKVVYTIADSYVAEGFHKGVKAAKEVWIQEGMRESTKQIAINMIKSNLDFKLISSVTGISVKDLQKLEGAC